MGGLEEVLGGADRHNALLPAAEVQQALRAVATSLGLTEVSVTDVSET